MFSGYVDRIVDEIVAAESQVTRVGRGCVDSIYLGGGTPTLLPEAELRRVFAALRDSFSISRDAEITVECAPGTITYSVLETLVGCGVNRVSLGVQSFVDQEAASVARLHSRETVLDDIRRLRIAGIENINVDLIAGLPRQTKESWEFSLIEVLATGVPHVSVYMLEVDEDSRLGRELIAGGTRYHAHSVPDEDATADFYVWACEKLNAAGVEQYEISNFARQGFESRHNLKYWTRQPYLGFGVDAHSMLDRVRFANPESLEDYLAGKAGTETKVSREAAREEAFFLGLRLNKGVNLCEVVKEFGMDEELNNTVAELCADGLLEQGTEFIRLTERGRLVSNEVFQRFIAEPASKKR
jgi:oxygen-independent coproporphyrinogen-3 oxidase